MRIKEYLTNYYYWLRIKFTRKSSLNKIDYDFDYDSPEELEEWSKLSEEVWNEIEKEEVEKDES